MRIQLFYIILFLFTSILFPLFGQDTTYTNPIGEFSKEGDTADPFVLQYDGKYYMYATSIQTHTYGYKVWESENLIDWVDKGDCFRNTDTGNEWGKENYWAPEVIHYMGKFYLIYSARNAEGKLQIALAKASSPLGPFINDKAPLLADDLECIDGHIFIDVDGTPYLYYAKEINTNIVNGHHVSEIYVQKLASYYLRPSGDPVLATTPDQLWEFKSGDWRWNEGPTVIKHNGLYYLMYSANFFASPDYSIGYATATSPMGPWTKYANNPVLSSNLSIGVSGPGHNSVVASPDGSELFIVYHAHINPDDTYAGRTPNIDRLYFTEDSLLHIEGPTRSPQPLPSTDHTAIPDGSNIIPQLFHIEESFPNPFNNSVIIQYSVGQVPGMSNIRLRIFNISGKEIKTFLNENKAIGQHRIRWNGANNSGQTVSSGIYLCSLEVDGIQADASKLIMIK